MSYLFSIICNHIAIRASAGYLVLTRIHNNLDPTLCRNENLTGIPFLQDALDIFCPKNEKTTLGIVV